ncbi:hypothetical protein EYF80_031998 [Liparis tanakae]|uniref:Uncharacterized protein n=1 Tax=Liparis tanakae TaxID=230148 RepID=A0A4Z2GYX9_9TELE|nr:hypothetical protein EYF80_031998 [Liparis tanakae]
MPCCHAHWARNGLTAYARCIGEKELEEERGTRDVKSRSISRRDANRRSIMRQHSSLVYTRSSHQGFCLRFNGSALVSAAM